MSDKITFLQESSSYGVLFVFFLQIEEGVILQMRKGGFQTFHFLDNIILTRNHK